MVENESELPKQLKERAAPFIELAPVLKELANEGYAEVIAEALRSGDSEGGLIIILNSIHKRLDNEGDEEKGWMCNTTPAETKFLYSPVISSVITGIQVKKKETEGYTLTDNLMSLTGIFIMLMMAWIILVWLPSTYRAYIERCSVPASQRPDECYPY